MINQASHSRTMSFSRFMAKEFWIGDVQAGAHDGAEVELKGWIKRTRGSNKIRFVVLRDSTGTIQCVAKRDVIGDDSFESLKGALIEASLILKGTVNVDERAPGGHELIVTSAEVIGPVNPETPFPITESAMEAADGGETEFLLDNRHLYLRTGRMTDMLKIQVKRIWCNSLIFPRQRFHRISSTKISLLALLKVVQHFSKFLTLAERPT